MFVIQSKRLNLFVVCCTVLSYGKRAVESKMWIITFQQHNKSIRCLEHLQDTFIEPLVLPVDCMFQVVASISGREHVFLCSQQARGWGWAGAARRSWLNLVPVPDTLPHGHLLIYMCSPTVPHWSRASAVLYLTDTGRLRQEIASTHVVTVHFGSVAHINIEQMEKKLSPNHYSPSHLFRHFKFHPPGSQ